MSNRYVLLPRAVLLAALASVATACSTSFTIDQTATSRVGAVAVSESAAPEVSHAHVEGDAIRIDEKIQFAQGAAVIEAASDPLLDELSALLLDNPQLGAVSIEGHTDDQGAASFNEQLSRDRAQAVRDALIERGVDPERLTATGFGERQPLVPNDSAAARQQNRRVEFHLTDGGAS